MDQKHSGNTLLRLLPKIIKEYVFGFGTFSHFLTKSLSKCTYTHGHIFIKCQGILSIQERFLEREKTKWEKTEFKEINTPKEKDRKRGETSKSM